jgi:hypothetical protein
MPKSRSKALPRFGRPGFRMPGHHGGNVTVVDPGVMQSSMRRAKLGFAIAFLLAGTTAAVAAHSVTGGLTRWLIGLLVGLAAGSAVFVLLFCWPVLRMTWHWLPELAAGTALLWAYSALTVLMPPLYAVGVLALALGGPFTFPPARRNLLALIWCVVVRHRLRVCFAEFIRAEHRHDGRLPFILPARPTPAGERVWLWLRPGLSLGELEGRYDKIAVACWATEVRAVATYRWAALLRVDIARRNALAAVVDSPLPDLVPAGTETPTADRPTPVVAGLDLPDVPDLHRRAPVPAPRSRTSHSATPAPSPAASTATPDDTADWI